MSWTATSSTLVAAVVIAALVQPLAARRAIPGPTPPSGDARFAGGYRAVWATGDPLASFVREGDRLVDVVRMSEAVPSIPPTVEGYLAREVRGSAWRAVVTVVDLESAPPGARGELLPGVFAGSTSIYPALLRIRVRVDDLISRRPEFVLSRWRSSFAPAEGTSTVAVGMHVTISYKGGGEFAVGPTLVRSRQDWERLPVRGRRYLWFLNTSSSAIDGGNATNVIDITEPMAQPMARVDGWTARPRYRSDWMVEHVRQQSTVADAEYVARMTAVQTESNPPRFMR
ncbi:MAG: hypothetical protein ABI880_12500 [Acidobacteriota bacterium]